MAEMKVSGAKERGNPILNRIVDHAQEPIWNGHAMSNELFLWWPIMCLPLNDFRGLPLVCMES